MYVKDGYEYPYIKLYNPSPKPKDRGRQRRIFIKRRFTGSSIF